MKIALVHDYLNEAGGAERVLRVLAEMYPTAPIYTAFVKAGTARDLFADREIHSSAWGWLLRIGRLYSYMRFCLPWIWRSIDLSGYDLVITSTSGGYIARGFRVGEKTRVVAYCHTPPKWLYGYETPTGAGQKWWGKLFMWVMGPPLRYFDYQTAQRVDTWIANSREVASRIAKFYRRSAYVVYPPVELTGTGQKNGLTKRSDFYLLVTRMTGAKGVTQVIEAAKRGKFKLKLAGEVVEPRLKQVIAKAGENVTYLGRVTDLELSELYQQTRGFIALAKDEDFGMTVVEAMQGGAPVLALYSGGYKETVMVKTKDRTETGIFIEDTKVESVLTGIKKMERTEWDHTGIAKWGRSFGRARFEREIKELINARTT